MMTLDQLRNAIRDFLINHPEFTNAPVDIDVSALADPDVACRAFAADITRVRLTPRDGIVYLDVE